MKILFLRFYFLAVLACALLYLVRQFKIVSEKRQSMQWFIFLGRVILIVPLITAHYFVAFVGNFASGTLFWKAYTIFFLVFLFYRIYNAKSHWANKELKNEIQQNPLLVFTAITLFLPAIAILIWFSFF